MKTVFNHALTGNAKIQSMRTRLAEVESTLRNMLPVTEEFVISLDQHGPVVRTEGVFAYITEQRKPAGRVIIWVVDSKDLITRTAKGVTTCPNGWYDIRKAAHKTYVVPSVDVLTAEKVKD